MAFAAVEVSAQLCAQRRRISGRTRRAWLVPAFRFRLRLPRTRSRAQEYCVKKGFVDNIELTFVAQAWTQRFGEKLNANLVKQAKIEANRSLSASAKKAALRDVRSERRLL